MQDDDDRGVSGSHMRRGRSRSSDAESPPDAKRHQRDAPDGAEARIRAEYEMQLREMAAALAEARQRAAELEESVRDARQKATEVERLHNKKPVRKTEKKRSKAPHAPSKRVDYVTRAPKRAPKLAPAADPAAPPAHAPVTPSRTQAAAAPTVNNIGNVDNNIVDKEFAAVEAACEKMFSKLIQFGDNLESLAEFSAFSAKKLRDPNIATRKNVVLCAPFRANKSPAVVIAGMRKLIKERPIVIFLTGVNTNTIFDDTRATITNFLSLIGALDMYYTGDDVKVGTKTNPTKRDEVIAKIKEGRPVIAQLRFDIHHLRPMAEILSKVFNGDIDLISEKVTFVFDEPQAKISSRGREAQRQKLLDMMGFRKCHVVYVSATVPDVRDINLEVRSLDTGAPLSVDYDVDKLACRKFYNCLDHAMFVELPSFADDRPLYGVKNCYGTAMTVDEDDDRRARDDEMMDTPAEKERREVDDEMMDTPADKEWREVDGTMQKILQQRVFQEGNITAFFGINKVIAKGGIVPLATRLQTLSTLAHNGYEPVDTLFIIHYKDGAIYFGKNGERGVVFKKKKSDKDRKASVPDAIALAWIDGLLTSETAIVILSNAAYQGACDYQINRSYKNMRTCINVPAHGFNRVITSLSAEVILARHENSTNTYHHGFHIDLKTPVAGLKLAVFDADAACSSASAAATREIGGLGKYVFLDVVVRTNPDNEFVIMAAESDDATADIRTLRMMEVVTEKKSWNNKDAVAMGTLSVPDALLSNMILFASKTTDSSSISQGAGRANTTDRSADTPLMVFATERDIRTVQALPSAQMKLLRLDVDDIDSVLDVTESENLVINARRRGHSRLKMLPVKVNVSPQDDYRSDKMGGDAEEDGDGCGVVGDGVAEKDWTDHEILIKILSAIDLCKERREEGKKRSSSEVVFKKGEIVAAGIVAERDTSRLNDLVRRQFLKEVVPDEEYVVSIKEYKQKMRDIFAVLDVETRTVERSVMYEKGILNEKKVEDYKEMGLIEEVEDGAKIRPTAKAYRAFMNGDTLLLWFAKTRTEFTGPFRKLQQEIRNTFPMETDALIERRTAQKDSNPSIFVHGCDKGVRRSFEVIYKDGENVYTLKKRG